MELPISAIIFRQDLYPRLAIDPATVQKYAADLDVLPPIKVNQKYELIDGRHRWMAHLKCGATTIRVIVVQTNSDAHLLELAIECNAKYGLQLSQEDKRHLTRAIYAGTPEREREEKKKHLAVLLGVSERTIRDWLSRVDKDAKEARNKRIFDRWMACWTQEEIAEKEGVTKETVSEICQKSADLPESDKPAAAHLVDFEVPLYNVWKQHKKTPGSSHFGNSEVRWVDNLLYLYTQPFDIVVDPFGGGGSTLDLCKRRFRRYWVSDRKPIIERASDIRQHDLTIGLPSLPRWQDVSLVYLDPPYWRQAEGQYSKDPEDLANMPLAKFTETLAGIINGFAKKLKPGARIALLIQPTQWKAPDRQYTDHLLDVVRLVKLPVDLRISCPYESEQCTAQMVEWAKANRQVLVLSRELVVWRV
ncbi:MAG TPA: ParB N-terminal domain-containing protein [Bryobacteraceae bacterium]